MKISESVPHKNPITEKALLAGKTRFALILRGATPMKITLTDAAGGRGWQSAEPPFTIPGFDFETAQFTLTDSVDDADGLTNPLSVTDFHWQTEPNRCATLRVSRAPDLPFFTLTWTLTGDFDAVGQMALLRFCPLGRQARVTTLHDCTDRADRLVSEETVTRMSETSLIGQIFCFSSDSTENDSGLFLVEEAPCPQARLAPDITDAVEPDGTVAFRASGLSFPLCAPTPVTAYGVTVGLLPSEEKEMPDYLAAFRHYYRAGCRLCARVISMSNTWGDRSQDTAICEEFICREIDAASALGVETVQIDDGWESGKTANSKLAKSAYWGSGYYGADQSFWEPDPHKFPHGFRAVTAYAKEKGVRVALWFSPDFGDSYRLWERDAQTLVRLSRCYGIRAFKLDGMDITDRTQEGRFFSMLAAVRAQTALPDESPVEFQLDITDHRRLGYLYRRELGRLFVENRYTDWGNYFPHKTLRNLWLLSRYLPTQRLQIEVLNVTRNAHKYGDDPNAPACYPQDYALAVAFFACPLFWMECSRLPADAAASLAALMTVRRPLREEIAASDVRPIGQEPSGTSFTGFLSTASDSRRGLLLLFRENTEEETGDYPLSFSDCPRFEKLAGEGEVLYHTKSGAVSYHVSTPRRYGLFRWSLEGETSYSSLQ